MEQIDVRSALKFNTRFFIWCITLPIIFFSLTFLLAALFSAGGIGQGLNQQTLEEFLKYYSEHYGREFIKIFTNNSFVAMVMIYFTPFALFVRKLYERDRKNFLLTTREKMLLYAFPSVFLTREAIVIALTVSELSIYTQKGMLLSFLGLIFPHGLPEFLALGAAGAIGMEVTRRCITDSTAAISPSLKVLSLLIAFIGICALLEVRLTPAIFALLMK